MRIALGIVGLVSTLVVLLCGGLGTDEEETSDLPIIQPIAEGRSPEGRPAAPGQDVWAPIPVLQDRPPARPLTFPSDERPRLVIFGGSWCPGCVAGMLHDAELSRRFRGRIDVVFALRSETDARFMESNMARWFSDMPVYSEASAQAVAQRCGVPFVPYACLVEGEQVRWTGGASDAEAVLDAFVAGQLEQRIAAADAAEQASATSLASGDPTALGQLYAGLHGFASRENNLAWGLVDRPEVPVSSRGPALALAQDATNATTGLDSAILDTYAVALARNDDPAGAARVARRVIEVCDAIGRGCAEERPRAEQYIAAAP